MGGRKNAVCMVCVERRNVGEAPGLLPCHSDRPLPQPICLTPPLPSTLPSTYLTHPHLLENDKGSREPPRRGARGATQATS